MLYFDVGAYVSWIASIHCSFSFKFISILCFTCFQFLFSANPLHFLFLIYFNSPFFLFSCFPFNPLLYLFSFFISFQFSVPFLLIYCNSLPFLFPFFFIQSSAVFLFCLFRIIRWASLRCGFVDDSIICIFWE